MVLTHLTPLSCVVILGSEPFRVHAFIKLYVNPDYIVRKGSIIN